LDVKEKVNRYSKQSLHYLNNAFRFLEQGDVGKSSEFLWGSFAEALKALASSKGITINKHWEIGDFVKELTKELKDKSIYDTYLHANALHKNFYEIEIDLDDIRRIAEDVRRTVGKLLNLIPSIEI
jgi:hypothetical protein